MTRARRYAPLFASLLASACADPPSSSLDDASAPPVTDAGASDAMPVGFRLQFIDPGHGPFTGGTQVTVRGNGFEESDVVVVGGRMVEPLDQEFVDSRRIIIATPPGSPGLADVEVLKGGDTAWLEDAFNYESIVVDPPSGSVAGGTFVTITGFATDFGPSTVVRFDGLPLENLSITNESVLTGYTPPGTAGDSDVEIVTDTAIYEADGAYTYLATADPFAGGMGGGPIMGAINVVVIDANSGNGVDGAFVAVGDPQTTPYRGYADGLGQITFSAPELVGPVTTTAAAPGYETSSFVSYDARDITIMLRRPPEPTPPGPFPPPPQSGRIHGQVLFGDATGLGSPVWNLVPEPRTAGEVKRVYVTTTARTMFNAPFVGTIIDYQGYDPSKVAWEFEIPARPSATAVVAMAGLYDADTDRFEPFAMGVARGILVGPGEDVIGVDVVVNIPLDSSLLVELDDPPALDTPGWVGPIEYQIRPFIDLGGEGAIIMNGHGLPPPPFPELRPGIYRFDESSETILLPNMAPLTGNLADTSYSFIVGAYSENGDAPYSVRIERGITNIHLPITIGDFLGTPRPTDPAPDTLASDFALEVAPEGPATGEATFFLHQFVDQNGTQLLRMLVRGNLLRVPIPDLTGTSTTVFPSNQDVSWTFYSVRVNGATFDEFNYRHLQAGYWNAYAADAYWVSFPSP